MTAHEVPENRWLAPQLSGRAQQAYAALNSEAASGYTKVKEAILRRYDVNEETYRQRFRTASMNDMRVRLTKKWTVIPSRNCRTLPADVGAGAQTKHWLRSWQMTTCRKSHPLAGSEETDCVCAKCKEEGVT